MQEGCEKAKAGNRWPCAREQAAERGEAAEGCARPGKYLWSGDSLSLSPVGIVRTQSDHLLPVTRAVWIKVVDNLMIISGRKQFLYL